MKFFVKFLIPLLFIFSVGNPTDQDCAILKNNSFVYKLAKQDVLVQFGEDKHVEYHQNKKYYIKSNIEWVSDCEYYLIIQDVTLPDFPFKLGSRLHIKITKVKGNRVYYKSSMGGRTWEGKMTKTTPKKE
ncbi:hypothetical protein AAON49_00640 [Pseudotenacibaculum sp. MALMAid0570]|uniref:hypothetical protein n=1 Tax=Pseudotenacibaculum sp. MALMAid0570 TaxID=3143938 RepID=UPI0032DEF40E